MPEGNIIRRPNSQEPARPTIKLPFGLHGAEPIFTYLMDTAAETLRVTQEYLAEQKETNRLLRIIAKEDR